MDCLGSLAHTLSFSVRGDIHHIKNSRRGVDAAIHLKELGVGLYNNVTGSTGTSCSTCVSVAANQPNTASGVADLELMVQLHCLATVANAAKLLHKHCTGAAPLQC